MPTSNPLLDSIEQNIDAFASTSRAPLPVGPHITLSSLIAFRQDPSVLHAFEQADKDLEQIDRIEAALVDARIQLRLRRARLETALAPISLLPPEIIRLIFREVHFTTKEDFTVVLILSHVSSSWRSVSLGQSELWDTINVVWGISQQRAWLERSGRQPLNIGWHIRGRLSRNAWSRSSDPRPRVHSYNPYAGPCDELWDVAFRWRCVHLSDCNEALVRRFLKRLIQQPCLRMMESMWLHVVPAPGQSSLGYSYDNDSNRVVLALWKFASPMPALRSLNISRIPLAMHDGPEIPPECISIVRGLNYLRIQGVENDTHNWALTLRGSTSLRVLIISGGKIGVETAMDIAHAVHLPELEALSLENTTAVTLRFAANTLVMPKLKTLHLDFPDAQFDHPMFLTPAIRCFISLFTRCPTITSLQVARENWVEPVITTLSRHCTSIVAKDGSSVSESPGHWTAPMAQASPSGPEAGVAGGLGNPANPPTTPPTEGGTAPPQSASLDSAQPASAWDDATAALGCSRNSVAAKSNDGGPLLPNLRTLRLNTGWTAEVRDLISYRASLLPPRRSNVIQGTTNALNYHYNSLLVTAGVDESGKEQPRARVFDTLGLMQLPKPDSIGYMWMREHVANIEANPDGWRGLSDDLMAGFA